MIRNTNYIWIVTLSGFLFFFSKDCFSIQISVSASGGYVPNAQKKLVRASEENYFYYGNIVDASLNYQFSRSFSFGPYVTKMNLLNKNNDYSVEEKVSVFGYGIHSSINLPSSLGPFLILGICRHQASLYKNNLSETYKYAGGTGIKYGLGIAPGKQRFRLFIKWEMTTFSFSSGKDSAGNNLYQVEHSSQSFSAGFIMFFGTFPNRYGIEP